MSGFFFSSLFLKLEKVPGEAQVGQRSCGAAAVERCTPVTHLLRRAQVPHPALVWPNHDQNSAFWAGPQGGVGGVLGGPERWEGALGGASQRLGPSGLQAAGGTQGMSGATGL